MASATLHFCSAQLPQGITGKLHCSGHVWTLKLCGVVAHLLVTGYLLLTYGTRNLNTEWFIHFLKPLVDVDALVLCESAPMRGGGRLVPVLTSTCMLPVLSRLKRSAKGFMRCLESAASSLLNSSSCTMWRVGVAGGTGGGLDDVITATVPESSASNECLL